MLGNPPRTPANPLSHFLGRNKATNHQHIAKEYIQFAAISHTTREIEEVSAMDDELKALREANKTVLFDKSQAYAPAACELCVVSECSYEVPILC